jgi:hypothetical protein
MKTSALAKSVTALVAVTIAAAGCGRSDNASHTKDIGLVAANGHQTVIWSESGLVFSKDCLDNETNLTRLCESGMEPRVTSYAGFFKTLSVSQGVASAYADFRGPERLTRDMVTIEKVLNEPGHTPQELAFAEERLNQLNDMQYRLGKVQRVMRSLTTGQDIVYSSGVNELYADVVASLKGDLQVWRDRVNGRFWTILSRPMNWFDAMEMPRVLDTFGNPSEPMQAGCSQQLGQGWRIPTINESEASYQSGLKQMQGIRQANPFWTANDAINANSASAYAYSVNVPIAQSRPKFQQVFTVCVRTIN